MCLLIDENTLPNFCNKEYLSEDEIIRIVTQCAVLGIKKIHHWWRTFSEKI